MLRDRVHGCAPAKAPRSPHATSRDPALRRRQKVPRAVVPVIRASFFLRGAVLTCRIPFVSEQVTRPLKHLVLQLTPSRRSPVSRLSVRRRTRGVRYSSPLWQHVPPPTRSSGLKHHLTRARDQPRARLATRPPGGSRPRTRPAPRAVLPAQRPGRKPERGAPVTTHHAARAPSLSPARTLRPAPPRPSAPLALTR